MTQVAVLTRETAIPNFTNPMGKRYKVEPWETNPGLYIVKPDNMPGPIPDELVGLFTSTKRAEEHIVRYLNKMWDMSDKQVAKNAK